MSLLRMRAKKSKHLLASGTVDFDDLNTVAKVSVLDRLENLVENGPDVWDSSDFFSYAVKYIIHNKLVVSRDLLHGRKQVTITLEGVDFYKARKQLCTQMPK